MSKRYVEILCFQYFERYIAFDKTDENRTLKQIHNQIDVSVVIEVDCVDI